MVNEKFQEQYYSTIIHISRVLVCMLGCYRNSAFATHDPNAFNWSELLNCNSQKIWLHVTVSTCQLL